ncbi:hypothetical protein TeGR_g12002 [Tetraparma gracilis]|uniref:Guanylate cyclase domain-containing protein n=1 Tax=Tetraparma gracilis TaxID=2962635 RepID=A0ABQ6MJW5_9STRA|nr:hypothetical protein TeGR_g12002 [Tetraparma gracilis]
MPEHLKYLEKSLEAKTVQSLAMLSSKWTRTKSLEQRLEHGLAKHSTCTTVFVHPMSPAFFDPDPHVVHDKLQATFMVLHSQTKRFAGYMRQFVLDDKGLVCIMAWEGAEKSHVYACQASLSIRESLNAIGVDVLIGNATGKVYCGPVGCAARSEYCFVGDSVNLAARLMFKADNNEILADHETNNKARSGVGMRKKAMIRVKGKETYVMTYAVESVRAAMDIRHGVGADAANISLDDPEDLFSHAGARLTVSFLDEIMTLAAGSIESAKPHVPHVMSELSGLMNIAQPPPVPSTRRHSNIMMSLSAKAFPSSPIASERRLSVRNDAVTTDDSKASLGAVVVLNLASEEAFKHATSFPPPPGNLRYILQEHGGDIISSTATQERPGGGSATYRIVALFTSKNGESLVCSRDSPAPRAPQLLIEDATRCILSIADATSSLTSCGVSVGEVESFLAGPLWVHTGAPISLAQTAAISASQQSHAICFCPSTADLLASLPLLKFSEESKLCVPSFPSTSEISDFLTSTDSAFSQRLYIVLWRKRIAETKVMVQTLLSHLPILDNRHVTENETGFDEPMIFKTPTYSIIIQLTPLKNYNKLPPPSKVTELRVAIDAVSKHLETFGGCLLHHHLAPPSKENDRDAPPTILTAIIANTRLDVACYVASSMRTNASTYYVSASALLTSCVYSLKFDSASSHTFSPPLPPFSEKELNSDECLCHSSCLSMPLSMFSSPLINLLPPRITVGEENDDDVGDHHEQDGHHALNRRSSWLVIVNGINEATKAEQERNKVVGRQAERRHVINAVPLFLLGMSRQMLLLEGTAGNGKSTITAEMLKIVSSLREVTVVKTAASPNHSASLFYLWRPVFARLLDAARLNGNDIANFIDKTHPNLTEHIDLL